MPIKIKISLILAVAAGLVCLVNFFALDPVVFSVSSDEAAVGQGRSRFMVYSMGLVFATVLAVLPVMYLLLTKIRRIDEMRQRMDTAFKNSEDRFKGLREASFGGVALHDQGVILDSNTALSDISGYSNEELKGMDGLNLIAPEWQTTVMENIQSDYAHAYDVMGCKKDGAVFPLEIRGKTIPYQGKKVRVTEFRDITDRKNMERRLTQALDELNTIIDSCQVGIMVLKGGRVLYRGNQRLADILGYAAPEQMAGLSMAQLHVNRERFEEFGEKYFNRLIHGEQIQIEYQLKALNGQPVWCTLSGKAIDSCRPPDLSKGVVWMVDDISQKRRTQEKLELLAKTDSLTGLYNRRHFMTLAQGGRSKFCVS
ncbi:MAG: PAS domain S-box protein [Desulfobacter sp.]|nr:MAG: PAS domain S-box protein [Desulfobacter sp.]